GDDDQEFDQREGTASLHDFIRMVARGASKCTCWPRVLKKKRWQNDGKRPRNRPGTRPAARLAGRGGRRRGFRPSCPRPPSPPHCHRRLPPLAPLARGPDRAALPPVGGGGGPAVAPPLLPPRELRPASDGKERRFFLRPGPQRPHEPLPRQPLPHRPATGRL